MIALVFLALVWFSPQQSVASPAVVECKLSMYPVDAHGRVGSAAILSPSEISSISVATDSFTGLKLWHVSLTPKGAASNLAYTQSHIGGKIAIFCGAQQVQQATIQGASSNEFEVSAPNSSSKWTPKPLRGSGAA
jgi:preprotein translocase subunit SecD